MFNEIPPKPEVRVILLFAFAILLVLVFPFSNFSNKETSFEKNILLQINGIEFVVEPAVNDEEKVSGLSPRSSLEEKHGMLFMYEEAGSHEFWMKDMKFPLDFVWIDSERKVVDVTENVSPESYPEKFSPSVPVNYILEVPAGSVKKFDIKTGDQVAF